MDVLYVALIYSFWPTERPMASALLKESFRIVIFIVPIVLLADSNFKIGGTPVDTANISWHFNRGCCQCRLGVSHIGAHCQSNKNRSHIPHQSCFGCPVLGRSNRWRVYILIAFSISPAKILFLAYHCAIFSTIRLHPFSRLVFAQILPTTTTAWISTSIPIFAPGLSPRDTFFLGKPRSGPVYFSMYSMIIQTSPSK